MEIVKLRLRDLQPSQFYISAGKLKAIERWLHPEDLSGFQPGMRMTWIGICTVHA